MAEDKLKKILRQQINEVKKQIKESKRNLDNQQKIIVTKENNSINSVRKLSELYHWSEIILNSFIIKSLSILCWVCAILLFGIATLCIIFKYEQSLIVIIGSAITDFVSGTLLYLSIKNLKYRHNSFKINERNKQLMQILYFANNPNLNSCQEKIIECYLEILNKDENK